MKNAIRKTGVLILIHLMTSCQKTISDSIKNELPVIEKKDIDKKQIITDSENPDFIYDLIETQKVSIGDTVLFRKWKGLVKKPITISSNEIKFKIFNDTVSKFYKTGNVKFSKDNITVLNMLSKKSFSVYSIAILDNDFRDAYDMNQATSYLEVKRKSKTVGTFDFSSPMYREYLMDFKIKDDAVHIIKLSNLSYSYSETYKYELDTLIVLGNNSLIYPDSLRAKLCKEKNRIPVKDSRK